jgi:uncharacterized membrane protein YgcG
MPVGGEDVENVAIESVGVSEKQWEAGIKKMMIDHPNIPFTKIPVDTQIQLTQLGVPCINERVVVAQAIAEGITAIEGEAAYYMTISSGGGYGGGGGGYGGGGGGRGFGGSGGMRR